ncbi:MAG: ABC transporter permease [Bacteroidia bacterium]|nr:ABC transporter permease [Bacteroidia bacterium]
MWKNYLLSAFRNLKKQPFYAIINILGLAVGLASCMLISLFVLDELSYDQFHEDFDRIHRMRVDFKLGEIEVDGVVTPAPFGPTAKKDFPEIEEVARFRERGASLVRPGGSDQKNIKEERIVFADKEVFDIFTFDILLGSPERLSEPKTIAISRSCRDRQFGIDADPIGKTLMISDRFSYQVVAVYEDLPHHSHFHFDLMMSMAGLEEAQQPVWVSLNFVTYLKLAEGADISALEAKFPGLIETYVGPQIQQFLGSSMEEWAASGNRLRYFTQPLSAIHLEPNLLGDFEPGGDIAYVWIFSAIAIFLLLIACVNFMNLATARSANRAREVGVRKALGSFRGQLVAQFLTESLLITAIGLLLAVTFAQMALPYFSRLSGKELTLPWDSMGLPIALVVTWIVVGLSAGIYPALFLSAFKPVEVLKGKLATGARSGWLRSALVVFQFTTSIVLIVSTFVVYQQLRFVQQRNLGFQRDQVLIVDDVYILRDKAQTFKQQILALPEVKMASLSGFYPVQGADRNNNAFWRQGNRSQETTVLMQNWRVDVDYVETMGMEIITGRAFSADFGSDSAGVILNETAVRQFDLGPDPLGKKISSFGGMPDPESSEEQYIDYTVIGVVKDFHYESLKDEISPLGLFLNRDDGSLLVKFHSNDVKSALKKSEAIWNDLAPNYPFSYSFLDDRFASMYESEGRVGQIFATFAGLAILIACLGLFALATFLAEQRTKEIGVRKVLGASITQIFGLLSQDFVKLVLIAIFIATPIAWYSMSEWLTNYTYKTDMSIWTFIAAGLSAILIALLTVSIQALKAAHTNPAKSLKDE